jgi:hypothetical protein
VFRAASRKAGRKWSPVRAAECVIMSMHYEVVFSCFLRDDTPEEVIDALRWHLGLAAEWPASLAADEPAERLLRSDQASNLPGGDIASLRRQAVPGAAESDVYAWGLFSRNLWLDDAMGSMTAIMELLAPHAAESGYGGYFREESATEATAFEFAASGSDGQQSGPPSPARSPVN